MRAIDAEDLKRSIAVSALIEDQKTLEQIIDEQPTIEERKMGKWIYGKCSNCGEHAPFWAMASTYYKSNFCQNCGADLRGDE